MGIDTEPCLSGRDHHTMNINQYQSISLFPWHGIEILTLQSSQYRYYDRMSVVVSYRDQIGGMGIYLHIPILYRYTMESRVKRGRMEQ
jgi:hypothetical protein